MADEKYAGKNPIGYWPKWAQILLFAVLLGLALVGYARFKSSQNSVQEAPMASVQVEAETQRTEDPPAAKQSPEDAHKFAVGYFQKVLEQEAFLKDAVRLKEVATVSKISMDAITGKPAWPDDGSADPYTKCETAWIDLGLLAGVQHNILREETAELNRIERKEAADYAKSKAACEDRVKMTPEQAAAAEAAE